MAPRAKQEFVILSWPGVLFFVFACGEPISIAQPQHTSLFLHWLSEFGNDSSCPLATHPWQTAGLVLAVR